MYRKQKKLLKEVLADFAIKLTLLALQACPSPIHHPIHLIFSLHKHIKSVFARHYLKVEDVKELVEKVNVATSILENDLLS